MQKINNLIYSSPDLVVSSIIHESGKHDKTFLLLHICHCLAELLGWSFLQPLEPFCSFFSMVPYVLLNFRAFRRLSLSVVGEQTFHFCVSIILHGCQQAYECWWSVGKIILTTAAAYTTFIPSKRKMADTKMAVTAFPVSLYISLWRTGRKISIIIQHQPQPQSILFHSPSIHNSQQRIWDEKKKKNSVLSIGSTM